MTSIASSGPQTELFVWAAAFALLSSACVADPRGEEVGTYRVTMSLVANSCGSAAVNLQDGRSYTAQLRADGSEAFWRLPGQQPLTGSYDDGRFRFSYSAVVARSEPDAGAFCQLIQDEVLEGAAAMTEPVFDSGIGDAGTAKSAADPDEDAGVADDLEAPDKGMVGRHIFTIKAASGTDCRAALAPVGAFERLPCTVRYDLDGPPTKSF